MANEDKKSEIHAALNKIYEKDDNYRRVTITILAIVLIIGCAWMFYAYKVVNKLNTETLSKKDTIKLLDNVLRHKRDSLRIINLVNNGLDAKYKNDPAVIKKSLLADSIYNELLKSGHIDTGLSVQYFYKANDDLGRSLEQQKVWVAIQTLGYKDVKDMPTVIPSLKTKKTNAIYVFNNVKLFDLKILSLMLLRSGFTINTIQYTVNPKINAKLVQIGSKGNRDQPFLTPPLTIKKVQEAKTIQDLLF